MRRPAPNLIAAVVAALAVVVALVAILSRPAGDPVVIRQVAPGTPADPAPRGWQQVVASAEPAVVVVRARFAGEASGDAQGTAFAIDRAGWLITNEHVVVERPEGEAAKVAEAIWLDYPDGRHARARLVGRDPDSDLALLRAEGQMPAASLTLAAPGSLQVGAPVATLGAPAGFAGSLSVGVVSGLDRAIPVAGGRFSINGAIQTDARVVPGSSGGPLLDARGRVVGVIAQYEGEDGGGRGAGFAVPVETLRAVLPALRRGGVVRHGLLGVTGETVGAQMASELGLPATEGVLVQRVEPGSAAAKAGLSAGTGTTGFYGRQLVTGGDLIVAADGRPLRSAAELAERVSAAPPGTRMRFELLRGSGRITLTVSLGARPLR